MPKIAKTAAEINRIRQEFLLSLKPKASVTTSAKVYIGESIETLSLSRISLLLPM